MSETPDGDDADRLAAAIRTLMRALAVRAQDTDGSGRHAFSSTELMMLGYLQDHPGARSRDVARFLALTPTTVQSVFERLIARTFVERSPHAVDGRAIALTLTDEGARALAAIRAQDTANCESMLAALPTRRRRAFVDDLETIAARLD